MTFAVAHALPCGHVEPSGQLTLDVDTQADNATTTTQNERDITRTIDHKRGILVQIAGAGGAFFKHMTRLASLLFVIAAACGGKSTGTSSTPKPAAACGTASCTAAQFCVATTFSGGAPPPPDKEPMSNTTYQCSDQAYGHDGPSGSICSPPNGQLQSCEVMAP